MSGSAVLYERSGHSVRITLNRPESSNAITLELGREFVEACLRAAGDGEVYAVTITGAGGVFCAGSGPEQRGSSGGAREYDTGLTGVVPAVAAIDKPVIAAINGDAFGQGLEIALACDIRVASPAARFGFPGVEQGLIPRDGGTQRLPRLVGKGKALEMILLAQLIDADEAEAIGLVSKVVPAESLAAEADAIAASLVTKAPIAMRYVKEAVNQGLDMTLEQGLRLEADLYFLLHTTRDRTEGIHAFLERRKAEFKGE